MNINIHDIKEIKKSGIEQLKDSKSYHRTIEITLLVDDFKNDTKVEQTILINLWADSRKNLGVLWA